MKAFIKIYKALLLYVTVFSICVFICCADYIFTTDKMWFFAWVGINIIYVWMCKNLISYKDFYKLSGMSLLDRLFN